MRFDIRRAGALLALMLLAGCMTAPAARPVTDAPPALLLTERFGPVRGTGKALFILVSARPEAETRIAERALAQALVARVPGSRAILVLRAGHQAATDRASPGDAGRGNGDDLTADRLALLAATIRDVEQRHPDMRPIVIGIGTGAAAVANLAGTRPQLVGAMVLAACPCALPEWRALRAKADPAGGWTQPVASLDPLQTAGGVAPGLRAVLIVGSDDRETPPSLLRAYAEALALRGIDTDFRILPGKGHDLAGDPALVDAAVQLATGQEPPR